MGQPALLPLHVLDQLERAQPSAVRLAQVDEDLVFGERQPGTRLQFPVQPGRQQPFEPQVVPPDPLLIRAEPHA
jgi:hypothetical protein